MKFIHLSDLHLGKRVNEYSMIEDQIYILKEILQIIGEEQPQAVLIAGDVYDKAVPSAEAVRLFDDFLVKLAKKNIQVLVISGNHDSPERIAFGGRLMGASGVHMAPVYDGSLTPVDLDDAYGTVHFWLLPFLKPLHVRSIFPEEPASTYTEAMVTALRHMDLAKQDRNVLLTHQFVTGAARSDSEEISVGGSDNVDAEVFKDFDYVALGHIHGPQSIGRGSLRYCGTPLKYSFSEAKHVKSVTVVELGKKGDVNLRLRPLHPLRDLREIRGTYEELSDRAYYSKTQKDDYLHITLTDEEEEPDAVRKLKLIYPFLMKLDYDNRRTRALGNFEAAAEPETKTPLEHFEQFFKMQNGQTMSEEQASYIRRLIEKIWEDPEEGI